MTNKILIISGATATGKSELAFQLGQKREIGIINADSLQIYQGLPILSAQPNEEQKAQIPHFLYSQLNPYQQSSVGLWLKLIEPIVKDLWKSNRLPVIVGGTGLYISKLVDGISEIPEIEDFYKHKARSLFEEMGFEEFQKEFGEEKISDKNRLIRACEVILQTKKPLSFWHNLPPKKLFPNAKIDHFNLNLDREKIYQNCNLRFKKMLELGAINEVKNLIEAHDFMQMNLNKIKGKNPYFFFDSPDSFVVSKQIHQNQKVKNLECLHNQSHIKNEGLLNHPNEGLDPDLALCQVTKTLGFGEIAAYLRAEISLESLSKIVSQKTRNYAKRQLTWFRHQFMEINYCVDAKDFFYKFAIL